MNVKRILSSSIALTVLAISVASCSASGGSQQSSTSIADSTTTSTAAPTLITNKWVGPSVDITKLPIGTSKVLTTSFGVGVLFACDAGNSGGGGAHAAGPWLNEADGTWDKSQKGSVKGDVAWPMARYKESINGESRVITSNGLPVDSITGTFPIAADDPAYAYDRNPNRIASNVVSLTLPASPTTAANPTCLGKGPIGVAKNGVTFFASIDERNRDAIAYETQDKCDGHPQQASQYHYHDIPSCILKASTGPSTVVGYANDGFPIVVERDSSGELPTNKDLDQCHGRTSPVLIDNEVVNTYHYSATIEFPYYIGCFTGKPVA